MNEKIEKINKNIKNCSDKLKPVLSKINERLNKEYKKEMLKIFKKIKIEEIDNMDRSQCYIHSTLVEELIKYKNNNSKKILKEQIESIIEDKNNTVNMWFSFVFIFYILCKNNKKTKTKLDVSFDLYFKDSIINLCNSLLFNSDVSIFRNKYYRIEFENEKIFNSQNKIKMLKNKIDKINFGSNLMLKNLILNILTYEILRNLKTIYNFNKNIGRRKDLSVDERRNIVLEERNIVNIILSLIINFNKSPYMLHSSIVIYFKNIELCDFYCNVVDDLIYNFFL